MTDFRHERHKPPVQLDRPRELIIACPPLRSNVNLSRIVRVASCCGVGRMIVCGNAKIDANIARDGATEIQIDHHRSLPPVLKKLKADNYELVGLEQTTNSINIHEFTFQRRTALVIGHERHGLENDILQLLDHTVEIPVYGLPYSYNVATATSMALYEFCCQFPSG